MTGWVFVTKHAIALNIIVENPRITGLELARKLDVTERTARKLIAELYENGYIIKKKEGRRIRYSLNPDQPLRQEPFNNVPIDSFLEALSRKKSVNGNNPKKISGK